MVGWSFFGRQLGVIAMSAPRFAQPMSQTPRLVDEALEKIAKFHQLRTRQNGVNRTVAVQERCLLTR